MSEGGANPQKAVEPSPTLPGESSKDALKDLSSQLSEPSLKSSTRVLIIFALALNRKLSFTDLLRLTGTGKGSLSNHLEKLEASSYIKTKSVMSFGGPRVNVEITEKGLDSYDNLVKSLRKLGK